MWEQFQQAVFQGQIYSNIVLSKREKFYDESASLFSRANNKEWELTISSLTFANTNYILKKLKSAKEAGKILKKFKVLVELLCLDNGTCFE